MHPGSASRRHGRSRGSRGPRTPIPSADRHEVKDIAGKVRASQALLEKTLPGDNFRGPLREHLQVTVYPVGPRGVIWDLCVSDGRVREDLTFRVDDLPPGTYFVHLETFRDVMPAHTKEVEAGTTDLVFDLDQTPVARGRDRRQRSRTHVPSTRD